MLRLSVIISIISAAVSLVGFANQVLIAKFFGASARLDDYLVAISLPTLVMSTLGGVFSYSIVPVLVRRRTRDRGGYARFLGMLLTAFAVLGLILPLGAYSFVPSMVSAVAPNLAGDRLAVAIRIARISWMILGCSMMVNGLSAAQNAARNFLVPQLDDALPYLGMIAGMLLFVGNFGTQVLPWGMFIGFGVTVPILYWGVRNEISFDIFDRALWSESLPVFANVPWVLLSMLCFTVYGAIDSFWASRLGAGNVSFLGYGQRLVVAFGSVVVLGPSTVLAPHLAEASALGDHDRFRAVLARSLRMVLAVASPVAMALVLLRVSIVELLFQRGAFDAAATLGVAAILPALFLGMVAMLGVVLMIKAMHAGGDLYGAASAGVCATTMYFILSGLLSRRWGGVGISWAYAFSWWIVCVGCVRRIFGGSIKNVFQPENRSFALALLTSLAAAWLMIAFGRWELIRPATEVGMPAVVLRIAGSVGLGVLGFLSISIGFFRMNEITALVQVLSRWIPLSATAAK